MSTLRVGIGASTRPDAAAAGAAAATEAAAQLTSAAKRLERLAQPGSQLNEPAGLAVVYATVHYDLPALLSGARSVLGPTPLVGATTSGQFFDGTVVPPGEGVAVLLLSRGAYRFGTAAVTGLGAGALEAGRRLATEARDAVPGRVGRHAALLLLADGLAGDAQELLAGVHRVAGGAVPVVGGAAGDDRKLRETFVLHGGQALTDAAVAVWIDADHPLRVVSRHGWTGTGATHLLTRVEGSTIHELDGRPAIAVFREAAAEALGPGPVRPGHGHPTARGLGLIQPEGPSLIRGVYVGPDDLLHCLAPLPQSGAVEVVTSRPDTLLDVTEDLVADALDGRDAAVVLTFSCTSRADLLGAAVRDEAARLQAAAGAVRTIGFYTYGEFARTSGAAGFHNATVAAVAL